MTIVTHSRALVYSGEYGKLELKELAIPALATNSALVQVDSCTLCGSDLHSLHGRRRVPVPTILGHEIVGTIIDTGKEFPTVDMTGAAIEVGDRVTWAIVANCGTCYYCERSLEQKCEYSCKYGHMGFASGHSLSGGLSQYCVLSAGTHLIKISKEMPLEVITPASCATATVMAAMSDLPSASSTNSQIAILGAGMLGLTACAVAKQRGWSHIVAVDPVESRRKRALRFGATSTFHPHQWINETKSSKKYGYDAVIELSGDHSVIVPAIGSLRTGGKLVLVGAVFPVPTIELLPEQLVRGLVNIQGVHNYRPIHLKEAVSFLMQSGDSFPFAELVSPWQGLAGVEEMVQSELSQSYVRLGVKP